MKKRKILFGMIIVNFISMLSGFVRDSSIAATLGSTTLADIFMFIINLPTMIFSSLGWVIMSTFLPAYTDVMVNQETKKLNEFSNTFIKCIMMIVTLIMIVLLIFKKKNWYSEFLFKNSYQIWKSEDWKWNIRKKN